MKKNPKLLAELKPELYEGLQKRGWTTEQLDKLWSDMLAFARYSFNKSHAAAYALMAYITMYLKIHHPKDFLCAWMNSLRGNTEKLSACFSEAKNLEVPVYLGKYNDCRKKCELYKDGIILGTSVIKGCNENISDDLQTVTEQNFTSFIDVISFIRKHTAIASDQFSILIKLNYFSDYGGNSYLLDVYSLYKKFMNSNKDKEMRQQININDLDKYGITEFQIEKYSGKKTKAQYRELDIFGLLKEIISSKDSSKILPLKDQIEVEYGCFNYVFCTVNVLNDSYYVVTSFRTYKDITKPYLTLMQIKTGKEINTKIKSSSLFIENSFKLLSILQIPTNGFVETPKTKKVNNKWIDTDEMEQILVDYEVLKE